MTTNAGSYKTVAMTRPMPIHTTYSAAGDVTCDHARTSATAATEPSVITGRGEARSRRRPTAIPAAPLTSSASENAPVRTVSLASRATRIGAMNTAKA